MILCKWVPRVFIALAKPRQAIRRADAADRQDSGLSNYFHILIFLNVAFE